MFWWLLFGIVLVEFLLRVTSLCNPMDFMFSYKRQLSLYVPKAAGANYQLYLELVGHPWLDLKKPVLITGNNYGFRGENIEAMKKDNEIRVFIVGDSFIADHYHDDSECINTLITKQLKIQNPNVKVFTTAFSGERMIDSLSMIIHKVAHLQPDVIVLFPELPKTKPISIPNNEDGHVREEFMSTSLQLGMILSYFYSFRSLVWLWRSLQSRNLLSVHNKIRKITYNFHTTHVLPNQKKIPVDAKFNWQREYYEFALPLILQLCRQKHSQLLIVNHATRRSVECVPLAEEQFFYWTDLQGNTKFKQHFAGQAFKDFCNYIQNWCSANAVQYLNLDPLIPKDKEYWVDDQHIYKGHDIVAKALANEIQKLF